MANAKTWNKETKAQMKTEKSNASDLLIAIRLGSTNEAIKILNRPNLNVNYVSDALKTALHYAAEHGRTEIAQKLIKKGTDPTLPDEDGKTALHYAAQFKSKDILKLLLEQPGVDVNAQDKDGLTALHYAARIGSKEMVSTLLKNGAAPTLRSKNTIAQDDDPTNTIVVPGKTASEILQDSSIEGGPKKRAEIQALLEKPFTKQSPLSQELESIRSALTRKSVSIGYGSSTGTQKIMPGSRLPTRVLAGWTGTHGSNSRA